VRQLVRDQRVSDQRSRPVFPGPKRDVVTDGESPRVEGRCQCDRPAVRVHPHGGEVFPEASLGSVSQTGIERVTATELGARALNLARIRPRYDVLAHVRRRHGL
jgi:hypothetical protein